MIGIFQRAVVFLNIGNDILDEVVAKEVILLRLAPRPP